LRSRRNVEFNRSVDCLGKPASHSLAAGNNAVSGEIQMEHPGFAPRPSVIATASIRSQRFRLFSSLSVIGADPAGSDQADRSID
jgi:hypothetical protein